MNLKIDKKIIQVLFYCFLVLAVAYFTYFRNYWYPNNLFWDENYYISSAYKYLNNVMFMEPHPPLGKLFIAWGEYLFHPNNGIDTSAFLSTDHITDIPSGFSFVGVRFFPVLFATFSSVLFFFILYQISKQVYLSFLFSSFYLFDNALIVHSRGAMLEGIQIFFILLSLWYFLILLEKKKLHLFDYFLFGVSVGLALSVKLNSSVLLLLFPFLYVYHDVFSLRLHYFLRVLVPFFLFVVGCFCVFGGFYFVHIQLGDHVVNGRYYNASGVYRLALSKRQVSHLQYFPQMFLDNIFYIGQYEKGVPLTDDNGSAFYTWPIGDRSINYRWDSADGQTRYLYLQGNPIIWFSGLLGFVMSVWIIVSGLLKWKTVKNRRLFFTILVISSLYTSYMLAMLGIHRVMYLYHYLIPLVSSLVLAFCVYVYWFQALLKNNDRRLLLFTTIYVISIVLAYYFFSPLNYYLPLTRQEFLLRSWFSFWAMKPI